MAHILLGLEGHLDANDFQLYCEQETLNNAQTGTLDTRFHSLLASKLLILKD